jgi:cysteine desulfurase
MGAACELPTGSEQIAAMTQRLRSGISASIDELHFNGDVDNALPGTLNMRFDGIDGEDLFIQLDLAGIAASSGSACASGTKEPSHVLSALGLSAEQVHQSLRFSLGRGTTAGDIDTVLALLPGLVTRARI